jgi:hypothetical protein
MSRSKGVKIVIHLAPTLRGVGSGSDDAWQSIGNVCEAVVVAELPPIGLRLSLIIVWPNSATSQCVLEPHITF